MGNDSNNLPDPSTNELTSVFERAYARLLPDMKALEREALAAYTLDVAQLATAIRTAAANLRPFRDEIAELPDSDVRCVDDLEDAVRALLHANALFQLATRPPAELVTLSERGAALRTRLHADVKALVARGVVDDDALKSYRGTVGYRVVAMDLILLASLLKRMWAEIDGKTATTRAELAEAHTIADALGAAVSERDKSPAAIAEAQQMRLLAYNLVLARYDEARRAMTYIRWHEDDVDTYAPSPYAGRGNGNHKKPAQAEAKSVTAAPIASVPIGTPAEDDPFLA